MRQRKFFQGARESRASERMVLRWWHSRQEKRGGGSGGKVEDMS